jgi:hypothetical protein
MDSSTYIERLLDLYQIYDKQASRLESHIWQTAALLGIGSAVGLVALASEYKKTLAYLGTTVVATIFAINASLVWWRFARRWWSIQRLKIERMDEIERRINEEMKFPENALVSERDEEVMKHRLYFRKEGSLYQRISNKSFFFSIPDDLQPTKSKHKEIGNYEYRGNQPAARLLLVTNIFLWLLVTIYTTIQIGKLRLLILIIFGFVVIIDFVIWRLR